MSCKCIILVLSSAFFILWVSNYGMLQVSSSVYETFLSTSAEPRTSRWQLSPFFPKISNSEYELAKYENTSFSGARCAPSNIGRSCFTFFLQSKNIIHHISSKIEQKLSKIEQKKGQRGTDRRTNERKPRFIYKDYFMSSHQQNFAVVREAIIYIP